MSIIARYKTCVRDTVCFCILKVILKKLKKNLHRIFFKNWNRFKPISFGLVRFFRTKTGLNWFDSVFPVWLSFSSLARSLSVWLGFFGFGSVPFSQNSNRFFFTVRFFQLFFFSFFSLIDFSVFFSHLIIIILKYKKNNDNSYPLILQKKRERKKGGLGSVSTFQQFNIYEPKMNKTREISFELDKKRRLCCFLWWLSWLKMQYIIFSNLKYIQIIFLNFLY